VISGDDTLVQLGPGGAIYRLRPPHTATSLRRESEQTNGDALRCRLISHKWDIIGAPYAPDSGKDVAAATVATIVNKDARKLRRCRRCKLLEQIVKP
jgi:hypothetical protein